MYEKISETPIREAKIQKLKDKILREIEKYSTSVKNQMKLYLEDNKDNIEYWNFLITREFILLKLKEFIKDKSAFQSIEAMYGDIDTIVYQVSDRELNIWLQDDYDFVNNFLCRIDENNGSWYIGDFLNNRFFGYQATNIIDYAIYDSRFKDVNCEVEQ